MRARALSHAQLLARTPRGSATLAEKQAADYVQAQLKSMGANEVHQQPFSGERSLWLFFAMVFGLALVGHAAFWLLRKPLGELPATVIAVLVFGFSGYMAWSRFTLRDYPLSRSLPHACQPERDRQDSSNRRSSTPPGVDGTSGQPPGSVLVRHRLHRAHLCAYLHHRHVRDFPGDSDLYPSLALTHWSFLGWIGLFLAGFHFLGWFTGVTADLGRYSPGANDNAASVGTVLGLAERLAGQPLQNTEVWLAFTGCEETNAGGTLALIDEYGEQLKDALFVDFEMVGIGDRISYVREEGNISRLTIPQEVETLVKQVGQPYDLHPVQTPLVGASTECSILLKHGFKAVCFIAHIQGSKVMPEWHRLTDTADKLQLPALERVHALAWDLLQRFDQG